MLRSPLNALAHDAPADSFTACCRKSKLSAFALRRSLSEVIFIHFYRWSTRLIFTQHTPLLHVHLFCIHSIRICAIPHLCNTMAISASNLHVTLTHAIAFLTRPLILSSYPATTVIKLQLMLEVNLTPLYAPTWVPHDPSRGSGRRCLSLSPHCLPPRAIYSACLSAGVQWFDWFSLLGGREFDFFVDPASVSVRYGSKSSAPLLTVWSGDESDLPVPSATTASPPVDIALDGKHHTGKTFAQQVLEDDAQTDDELFAMLADEISVPTWMTPILDQFPIPVRSISPLSDISSRSSSPASVSYSYSTPTSTSPSSSFSSPDYSCEFLPAAFSSPKLGSATEQLKELKLSRRERARRARVFVDVSKTTVTPYDGGRTTVLTGGVMLGGAPKSTARAGSHDWRFSML